MSAPPGLRALVVEADPGLREIFETLLEGWRIQFVWDPWALACPVPADVDLLVVDEDYPGGPDGRRPAWLKSLSERVPAIMLRTPSAPFSTKSSTLILPKPFPVASFLTFAALVRQANAPIARSQEKDS